MIPSKGSAFSELSYDIGIVFFQLKSVHDAKMCYFQP